MCKLPLALLLVAPLFVVSPALQCAKLHGADPESTAEKSSLAEKIAAIAAEQEKQQKLYSDGLRAAAKTRETLGLEEYFKQVNPIQKKFNEYQRPAADALAELIKANPSDPAVVEGIILYQGPMRRSLGIVIRNILLNEHFANPALAKLCLPLLVHDDPDAEFVLAAMASRHPIAEVRGVATYTLGAFYYRRTTRREPDRQLGEEERNRLLSKAEQHFAEVVKQYATAKFPNSQTELGKHAALYLVRIKNAPNLRPGKVAPEFVGTDLDGKPVKLADFRGKVIVLVYWGSWCGPCMAQVPHDRKLVERMKDKPFVLVGVNCGDTLEKARQTVAEKEMNWISILDGDAAEGPLQVTYNVLHWPASYVIDDKGVLQHIDIRGKQLDAAVDKLVAEIKSAK
jgi:peroxiredoxin